MLHDYVSKGVKCGIQARRLWTLLTMQSVCWKLGLYVFDASILYTLVFQVIICV